MAFEMSEFNQEIFNEDRNSCDSIESCDTMEDQYQLMNKRVSLYGHGKVSYKYKVKTEICKYWRDEKACPFGESCAFAHGGFEIREKIHVPLNYKTKVCKNYVEYGLCIYGERCQFLHPGFNKSKLPQLPYQSLLNEVTVLFKSGGLKERLPVFQFVS